MTSPDRARILAAADCSRVLSACGLVSTYAELARVDGALRVAEHNLIAAHQQHSNWKPWKAQDIYVEVLGLRERVRQLLDELSELWVRADGNESGLYS